MRFRSIQRRVEITPIIVDADGTVVIPMRFRSIQRASRKLSDKFPSGRNPYEIQVNTKLFSCGLRIGQDNGVVIPMRFRSIQSPARWTGKSFIRCKRRNPYEIQVNTKDLVSPLVTLCKAAAVVIPMRFRSIQSWHPLLRKRGLWYCRNPYEIQVNTKKHLERLCLYCRYAAS